jgi:type II secretory pathway pseudopilin PulG
MMKSYICLLQQLQNKSITSSQKGLTLVEALAAIVITTVILTAMAPPILFSAATRVQSRKVEQAQAIARQELDRVRTALAQEQGVPQSEEDGIIPPVGTLPLHETGAPQTAVTERSNLNNSNNALEMDADGDGDNDFLIQLIRDEGVRFSSGAAANQLAVFQMGIRVYDIAAEDNLGDSLETTPASLQMTKGLGQRATHPLAVLYTEVSRSDLNLSVQEYREYICDVKSELAGCS